MTRAERRRIADTVLAHFGVPVADMPVHRMTDMDAIDKPIQGRAMLVYRAIYASLSDAERRDAEAKL